MDKLFNSVAKSFFLTDLPFFLVKKKKKKKKKKKRMMTSYHPV